MKSSAHKKNLAASHGNNPLMDRFKDLPKKPGQFPRVALVLQRVATPILHLKLHTSLDNFSRLIRKCKE